MSLDVLIVDDERPVLRMCRSKLTNNTNFSVETAFDSKTALEITKRLNPRLVLLDIHLAKNDTLNGVDCISKMRRSGYNGLICMMTGDPSINTLLKTAMAGADDYMVKNAHLDFAWEISLLFKRLENKRNTDTAPLVLPKGSIYLRSLGLEEFQVELLANWHASNYLKINEFAEKYQQDPNKTVIDFVRVRTILGLANNHQLARLLTVIAIFEARLNSYDTN